MWTKHDILDATGGESPAGNFNAMGFSIDTRNLESGQVFVALQGERVDGHRFVAQALEKGAVAALVQFWVEGVPQEKQILVEDTEEALRDLARFHRARLKAKIVAVTGSVGKTGAKEMLRVALSTKGSTYASYGNFNNHIGAPLCLANMPMDAAFGVFELGMNHAGEISQLSTLVQPHLSMITTVEAVHLEFFDSEEQIADAKAEIFDGMGKGGSTVLNVDNPHFLRLKRAAEQHGLGNIISFGVNELAICRLLEYGADQHGSDVTAVVSGTKLSYRIGTIGKHWALSSVAVLAAADALGCDLPKAAESLAQFKEPKGRGRITSVAFKGEEAALLVVDDSYNASPSSMKGAFEKMCELKKAHTERRLVALLGDMLELGDLSAKWHENLAEPLVEAGFNKVATVGRFMPYLRRKLPSPMSLFHADNAEALIAQLPKLLEPGDMVLVKGSHGSGMWKVAEALLSGNMQSLSQGAANAV